MQNRRPSPYCHCPVCLAREGIRRMRAQFDDAATTVATTMDLLERFYSDKELEPARISGMFVFDGLTLAYQASEMLEKKLQRLSQGRCHTEGTTTLVDPATVVPLGRLN